MENEREECCDGCECNGCECNGCDGNDCDGNDCECNGCDGNDCECNGCECNGCECNGCDGCDGNGCECDHNDPSPTDCDCGCRDGICTCVANDTPSDKVIGDFSITDLINSFIAYGNPSSIQSPNIDINDPTFQSSVMRYLKRFENDITEAAMTVQVDNMYRPHQPPRHAVYTGFKVPSLSLIDFYQRFFRCRFDTIPSYTLVKMRKATAEELFAMDAYSAYMKEYVNSSIHYTVTGDVDDDGKWHWKRCIHGVSPYDVHYTDTFDSDGVIIDPLDDLDEEAATNYFDIDPLL